MNKNCYLLVGTYTSGRSKGIQLYRFDPETGESSFVQEIEVENPSYLTSSRDGQFVYAVSENEQNPSYISAFTFDKEAGKLIPLNRQETFGAAPCYVELDNRGRHALTANYGGGNISVFSVDPDGELSEIIQKIDFSGSGTDPERQDASHLHCVKFSPDGNYLFATDLGTDHIYRLKLNTDNGLTFLDEKNIDSFDVPAGSGPRHLLFHPSGDYVYLITELKGEVIVFSYAKGEPQMIQTIRIDEVTGNEAGDIDITPDGRFLYASSRTKNDGVALFSIDQESGKLQKKAYIRTGTHPRNIKVTPNGKFLLVANRDSNSVEIYRIDSQTGELTHTDKDIRTDKPVCVYFII